MTAVWMLLVLVFLYAQGDAPQVVKGVLPELELPCLGPAGVTDVIILEWKRGNSTEYVLFNRGGTNRINRQEQFFYKQVELKDPDFKSGDLSVILKNVTKEHSGTYTCEALVNTTDGEKTVKNTVDISVTDAGLASEYHSGEHVQLQCLSPEGNTVQDRTWAKVKVNQTAVLIRMRDGRVDYTDQDPSFKDRVNLRDPKLLNVTLENVTLENVTLENVTTEDSGTYVCETRSNNSDGNHKIHMQFVHLTVKPVVKGVLPELELPCLGPAGVTDVIILEWKRGNSTEYVLFNRDDKVWENKQELSFYNRVELKDPDFKSGDLSVILKNVTKEHSGTYMCKAQVNTPEGKKTVNITVDISVTDAGLASEYQSGEHVQLQCLSPEGNTVQDLTWAKVKGNQTAVLIRMRDGRVDYTDQDPSFKDRVNLRDPRLLNVTLENVTLENVTLENVTTEDSGTYVCETRSNNSDGNLKIHMHFVHLTEKPDMTLKYFLILLSVVVLIVVGLVIFIASLVNECKKKNKKSQMESKDVEYGLCAEKQSDDMDAGGGRPGESAEDGLLDPGLSSSTYEESHF